MIHGGHRRQGAVWLAVLAVVATACGDDDQPDVVERAFDQLATVGSTYEIALSDSNALRTCVGESGGEPAALQVCADNGSDAISGPDTVATVLADRAAPLSGIADDERATNCLEQVDLLDQRLAAWFAAATAWRTAHDADPTNPALTGELITAVGDRQHDAEAAWTPMRQACSGV